MGLVQHVAHQKARSEYGQSPPKVAGGKESRPAGRRNELADSVCARQRTVAGGQAGEAEQGEEKEQQQAGVGKAQGKSEDAQRGVDGHPHGFQSHGNWHLALLRLDPTGDQELRQEPPPKTDGRQKTDQGVGAAQRPDKHREHQIGMGEVHPQLAACTVGDAQQVVSPVCSVDGRLDAGVEIQRVPRFK